MRDIKFILEGIVSQAKPVGSGGSEFRKTSSSKNRGRDHGVDVGAHRNYAHEKRAKDAVIDSAEKREKEVKKRNREAEQRQKETMNMAKEETVTEAKHVFHVHMKDDDTRSHKMVDDKTSEPVGSKPKSTKLVMKVPAADSREARNKVSKHIAKNYGVSAVKSIEYKGLDEETVTEAKKFVFDKPQPAMVKAYDKRDTSELHGMHKRWSSDHSSPKNNPETSEKLLAVHHVLKSRGENVGDLPKHKNLGLSMHEETNTEKRMKIKNVARPDDAAPTSEKSTLAKTGEIKTKIIEDKPTMSVPNFGLSASLINAARQIVEKKHEDDGADAKKMTGGKTAVELEPETNDKMEDSDNKPAKKKSHTVPKTDKEKKLAALASPKDKITHKDVLVGRGVVKEDEQLDERERSQDELVKKWAHHSNRAYLSQVSAKRAKADASVSKDPRDFDIAKGHERQAELHKKAQTAAGRRIKTEEIGFSAEELARLEEISRTFAAEQFEKEVYEAAMKSVPSTTTAVSSPIRGANQDQSGIGTKSSSTDYTISDSKKMKVKEEVELDEARGRPRKNPLPAGQEPEGDDTHKHPMQQLEKIAHSIAGNEPHFEHKDGSKTKVGKNLARHMVVTHNSMKTTQEKNNFADKLHANRDSMRSEMGKHF